MHLNHTFRRYVSACDAGNNSGIAVNVYFTGLGLDCVNLLVDTECHFVFVN